MTQVFIAVMLYLMVGLWYDDKYMSVRRVRVRVVFWPIFLLLSLLQEQLSSIIDWWSDRQYQKRRRANEEARNQGRQDR